MLYMTFVCPSSTLGTGSTELSLSSRVHESATFVHKGIEQFSHSQRRCSIVSIFSHLSHDGVGLILDLYALLFVHIVRFSIWKAVSRVFEVSAGRRITRQALLNILCVRRTARLSLILVRNAGATPMEVFQSETVIFAYETELP